VTGAVVLPIDLAAQVQPSGPPPLPRLRQELRIEPGAPLPNGAPTWTLFDPVRHQFFQLGAVEFRLLNGIASGSIDLAVAQLRREGMDDEAIGQALTQVVEFAYANLLTVDRNEPGEALFARHTAIRRKAWWKQLLDNYLFFRVPLVRPAPFLARTVGRVDWIYSRGALTFFILLTIVNLWFVSREWDLFLSTIQSFLSWQGIIAYALGLTAVKLLHELGHAYTATRYGCRVPSMGVSFLVMFPVLYTDTTGVWKLTSRRKRLAVDCAGVGAELIVASICTTLWLVLPEGTLRSVAFVLATSSWLISLSINLNPFMRFDGYYVLADLLNLPNLQPRSFALARWRLREWLFALSDPPPEVFPVALRRGLIIYAFATWLYRFVLFLGIALLVYYMFFKLLGIILFIVEIGVFIVRPVAQELRVWWVRRGDVGGGGLHRRPWVWLLGGGLILCLLPLDRHVSGPAVMAPAMVAPLVAGSPAVIERIYVTNGMRVQPGTAVAELRRPDTADRAAMQRARITQIEAQLARSAGSAEDLANRAVLESELAAAQAALRGVAQQQDRLILRAPAAGIVTDIGPDMHVGRWLNGTEVVARIVDPIRRDVQVYVNERDAARLIANGAARFVPDDALAASQRARIVDVSTAAVRSIDSPALASRYGGPIAVDPVREGEARGELHPRQPQYRVRLVTPLRRSTDGFVQPITGEAILAARPESIAGRLFRQIMVLFRREASLT
jgi:putative peptide zinc metalloprotease protein